MTSWPIGFRADAWRDRTPSLITQPTKSEPIPAHEHSKSDEARRSVVLLHLHLSVFAEIGRMAGHLSRSKLQCDCD